MVEEVTRGARQPLSLIADGWDFEAVFRREAVIREVLAIAFIASGLSLLSWALAAPERVQPVLPVAIGELMMGIWLLSLQTGGRERR